MFGSRIIMMKKILTTLFLLVSICSQTNANEYSDGYNDGFDAGYKLSMIEMGNIDEYI